MAIEFTEHDCSFWIFSPFHWIWLNLCNLWHFTINPEFPELFSTSANFHNFIEFHGIHWVYSIFCLFSDFTTNFSRTVPLIIIHEWEGDKQKSGALILPAGWFQSGCNFFGTNGSAPLMSRWYTLVGSDALVNTFATGADMISALFISFHRWNWLKKKYESLRIYQF